MHSLSTPNRRPGQIIPVDPAANARTLHNLIRGPKLTIYPDAGHAFPFHDWASFAKLVNSFR
jgi:pimeloyl-ACP methyl ester carboxylesterase